MKIPFSISMAMTLSPGASFSLSAISFGRVVAMEPPARRNFTPWIIVCSLLEGDAVVAYMCYR